MITDAPHASMPGAGAAGADSDSTPAAARSDEAPTVPQPAAASPSAQRRGRRPNVDRIARPFTMLTRNGVWYIRASVPGMPSGTRWPIVDGQGLRVRDQHAAHRYAAAAYQALLTEGERRLAGVAAPRLDSIVATRAAWEASPGFAALHPHTQRQYQLALDRLAMHTDFGNVLRISAISDDLVHRWMDQLEAARIVSNKGGRPSEGHPTPSMLHTAVASLSSLLTFASRAHEGRPKILSQHPLRGSSLFRRYPIVRRKDEDEHLGALVSLDAVTRLLDVVDSHKYTANSVHLRVLMYLLLYTGARRNEALGLTWRHVNFDAGLLSMGNSKRKKGRRTMPLWPALAAVLAEHHDQASPSDDALVVSHANGDALGAGAGYQWLETMCRAAGIPYTAGFHFARHAYITARVRMLAPLEVIQREVGHSQASSVTEAVYLHQSEHLALEPIPVLDYHALKDMIERAQAARALVRPVRSPAGR